MDQLRNVLLAIDKAHTIPWSVDQAYLSFLEWKKHFYLFCYILGSKFSLQSSP